MKLPVTLLVSTLLAVFGASRADEPSQKPVSFSHDVMPLFKRSCTGCHHPGKLKGELDLTTYAALVHGGKHGPEIKAHEPKNSRLLDEISGEEPSMPKEGDPLSKAEVSLIEQWIAQGAPDDSPPAQDSFKLKEPPTYSVAPVLSALAYSKSGELLAVSGYHEVVLHKSDGSKLVGRLVGESPRIESLAFSPNDKELAIAGSAPARFGEVQIWDVSSQTLKHAFKVATDSIYGISYSPDGGRIAFGCADKTVRIIRARDGESLLKFDNHSDWVLATTFTHDGKRLLSGSRDRAMKLIDPNSGQFIDDINKLLEGVLCMARHPTQDEVVYGGDLGGIRIYRMAENQQRTAANNDVNMLREFERQPGPVRAVAFSPDGQIVAAAGSMPEVRLYRTKDGSLLTSLTGHTGAIFCLAFHPSNGQIVTGGYDGMLRVYEAQTGKLETKFLPVPLKIEPQVAGTK